MSILELSKEDQISKLLAELAKELPAGATVSLSLYDKEKDEFYTEIHQIP